MNIQAMLNPADDEVIPRSPAISILDGLSIPPPSTNFPRTTPRTDKFSKDGFLPVLGIAEAPVNYPAYEVRSDPDIVKELDKFSVSPDQTMEKLCQYPRHIPYASTKKDFLEKTGRKGFKVFQYEFHKQDKDGQMKKHLVLWDYQVGSVRITPFFKALHYSKTTPSTAVKKNPGLQELTVSITGGSLAAQGYWMPFDCAKAMAATFCFEIRHLLVPIFGKGFLDQCVRPTDPAFGTFLIDPAIVRACTEDMNSWKSRVSDTMPTPRSVPSGFTSPVNSPRDTSFTPTLQRTLRPHHNHNPFSPELDSGYTTDSNTDLAYSTMNESPQVSPKTVTSDWTPINRVRRTPTAATTDRARTASPQCTPLSGLLTSPPTGKRGKGRKHGPPTHRRIIPRSAGTHLSRDPFTARGQAALGHIAHIIGSNHAGKEGDRLLRLPKGTTVLRSHDAVVAEERITKVLLALRTGKDEMFNEAIKALYNPFRGPDGQITDDEARAIAALVKLKSGSADATKSPVLEASQAPPATTGLGIQMPITTPSLSPADSGAASHLVPTVVSGVRNENSLAPVSNVVVRMAEKAPTTGSKRKAGADLAPIDRVNKTAKSSLL